MTNISDFSIKQDFHEKLSKKFPYVRMDNWVKLQDIAVVKYLEKNETLLRHGDRLKVGVFVVKGWLKLSYLDEKGNERISTFCSDFEYIDNWNNIHQEQKLPYSVNAITSSIVILYPLKKMIDIFSEQLDLLQLCIHLSQEMLKKKQSHYEILTFRTPEERYLHLLKHQKKWLMKITLKDLAKYLHLSREAVSRARNNILSKQQISQ